MTAPSRYALAALACAVSLGAADPACVTYSPCYSSTSVVNSASYAAGWLAPGTFASVFGTNLADGTAQGAPGDQNFAGALAGVRVIVNNQIAYIDYASPTQVNFVVPSGIDTDTIAIQLARGSAAGPTVTLALHDSAPALFQLDSQFAIAAHADWSLVTQQAPAHAGDLVMLYATGLGPFLNPVPDMNKPVGVDPIARLAEFQIYLDGQPVDKSLIQYVGAEPVSVGVYQINLLLPAILGKNPEIRLSLGTAAGGNLRLSPPGVRLPVQ
jgi:uncharacterized protein (TIGR03437 family)